MAQQVSPAVYSYIRIASTFGLTMGMNIYLFSVVIGGWLDKKFDCSPVFSLILLFLAVGMGFAYLIKQIQVAEKVEKENKKAMEDEKKK